jgi:hypothetical protein
LFLFAVAFKTSSLEQREDLSGKVDGRRWLGGGGGNDQKDGLDKKDKKRQEAHVSLRERPASKGRGRVLGTFVHIVLMKRTKVML